MEAVLKETNAQGWVDYDRLTRLANRQEFDQYLSELWQQGKRELSELGVILCDLDAFKSYNDYFGHQAGDDCLQQVAGALKNVAKRPLNLLARFGGEKFAILLPNTSQVTAVYLAEQIQEAVTTLQISHPQSPVSKFVTVSQGITGIIPRHNCSPEMLIAMADNALDQAKENGGNRVVLNNELLDTNF